MLLFWILVKTLIRSPTNLQATLLWYPRTFVKLDWIVLNKPLTVCGGQGQALQSRPGNLRLPQGIILGSLLFLLYVNDLPNNLKSSIRLFADDALLYGIVSSDLRGDQLQEDLKELEVWQSKSQMSFNPAKCKTICLSTKKVPPQRKYVFCGVELEQVNSISYLGVNLNNNLKWSNHISSISGKAHKVLGLIKRNLWNCPKQV